jgi:cation transport regulator ChaC
LTQVVRGSTPRTVMPDEDALWYFAYGSNMESSTFRGRRGITWRRAVAARVPGWRLVFDKPPLVPAPEGYGNIVADAAAEVYGVLYELALPELEHVELTEGVLLGNYRRVEVAAWTVADGRGPIAAVTLASDRREPERRPSERYLRLVVAGAEEHGLPAAWVDALRAVPAIADTDEALRQRAMLDDVLRMLRRDR